MSEKKEEENEEAIKDVLPVVGAAVGGPVGGAVGIAAGMVQGSAEDNKKKKIEILPYEYMGYIRAFFRTCGFIFIALGTFFIFWNAPLLKFIPLIVLSIAITSNPYGTVRTDMEVGLSVLNMMLGVLMVIFFGVIFFEAKSELLLYGSLLLISAGFFITIPFSKNDREDSASKMLNSFYKAGESMGQGLKKMVKVGSSGIFKIIILFIFAILILYFAGYFFFFVFVLISSELLVLIQNGLSLTLGMGMAILAIIIGIKFGNTLNGKILGILGGIGILLGSVALINDLIALVVFSLVVGMGILSAVPVDRLKTFIGIPIVMIALMTTTMAYPDVMGTTVFGPWWPTIDYNLDNTLGPLLQGIKSPLETMGTGYQCLINPVECYQNYEPQTSTKKSIRSVEVTRLEVIGDDKIDKSPDTVMIIATVENKGKEDAENIEVVPWVPFYSQGIDDGTIAGTVKIKCENGEPIEFTETNYKTKTGCNIPKLLAGEIREFVLNYSFNNLIRGNYISYGANVTYDLNLKGQVDVMVMDEDYYYKLARSNELSRKEQVTEDTGGPIRLGLALMRNEMPVKDNITGVPVLLYLKNQGPGILKDIKSAEVDISDIEGVEGIYCKPDETGDRKLIDLDEYMRNGNQFKEVKEIESGKSLSSTCISKVPDISVEQKTFAITGEVDYTYMHSMERKIMVDFGAWVTCTCTNSDGSTYQIDMFNSDQCVARGCQCTSGCA